MKRVLFLVLALFSTTVFAQQNLTPSFSTLVGPVKIGPVAPNAVRDVPYLTWGADVALFEANGGLDTTPDSLAGKLGLKLHLVNGDDFVQQTRNYLTGKTPYLRGTFSQIASACEVLNQNPDTKPVMIYQLSWSAGDHAVAREEIKTLNDLKGKTICLQQGGPHVGMLDDMLRTASLKWTDVKIKWSSNLTGNDSPSELFRKDSSIDIAFVISPDMIGLTGGLELKGTGAEGTVKGAHVVVSTATMNRSIADVQCVRNDFYKSNRAEVEKFLASYLAGSERLVAYKNEYNDGKGKSPNYLRVLKMTQKIYGEKVLPTLEVDTHGLIIDALLSGLPGQMAFFNDPGNLSGFDAKQKSNLDLVIMLGYATTRAGIAKADWDYAKVASIAGIEYKTPVASTNRIKAEAVEVFPDSDLDERTIVTYSITFEPEQTEFNLDTYSAEFRKVVQDAQTFRNAVVVVRGHSDPTKTLVDLIKNGMNSGLITREGRSGGYKYFMRGKPLDLTSTPSIIQAIQSGQFSGQDNPQETMQAAMNLSQKRADEVKNAIAMLATQQKINLDISQIKSSGIGIREPIIAKPSNIEEAKKNMRVEFKLVKVNAEAIKPADFDY